MTQLLSDGLMDTDPITTDTQSLCQVTFEPLFGLTCDSLADYLCIFSKVINSFDCGLAVLLDLLCFNMTLEH